MHWKSIHILFCSIWLLSLDNARAATRSLSLQEAIRIAVEHNFDVQIEQKNVDAARARLHLAYGDYDPVLRTSVVRGESLSPGGIDDQNRPFDGTQTDRNSVSSGLGGLLPTGLSYDISGQVADSHGLAPGGAFENTGGGVGIQLRQPLLKNLWIDATRLGIRVNRKQLRISELVWRAQLMEIVTRVEWAFYDLLLARENVKVQEQALQLAEQLLTANRERIQQGVLASLDEKQAESRVSAQRSLLLIAQRNASVQQNVLKGLLSDNLKEWSDMTIEPAGEMNASAVKLDRNASAQRGMAQRPDLLKAREDIERLGYIVKYRRNQLLPQLDAVGSYGHSASGAEFSDALGQVRRGSSPFHSYGLQLTVPFSRRAERSQFKASVSEKEKAGLQLRQLEQQALIEIDNAVRSVETDHERVGVTRQAREFAEAALQAEQTKMDNGKSTSFVVLQLQKDLTAARSEEVRALAEFNKSQAELSFREGTVMERHQLDLVIQ